MRRRHFLGCVDIGKMSMLISVPISSAKETHQVAEKGHEAKEEVVGEH